MDDNHDESDEGLMVSLDADAIRLMDVDDAVALFDAELGSGMDWSSQLMQYRTTADFQKDWKAEVGNWLERERRLGFSADVRNHLVGMRKNPGNRSADDPVHRAVHQWLAQAMVVHYFVGAGWQLHEWEPGGKAGLRGNG